jgi:hypothetical protein
MKGKKVTAKLVELIGTPQQHLNLMLCYYVSLRYSSIG